MEASRRPRRNGALSVADPARCPVPGIAVRADPGLGGLAGLRWCAGQCRLKGLPRPTRTRSVPTRNPWPAHQNRSRLRARQRVCSGSAKKRRGRGRKGGAASLGKATRPTTRGPGLARPVHGGAPGPAALAGAEPVGLLPALPRRGEDPPRSGHAIYPAKRLPLPQLGVVDAMRRPARIPRLTTDTSRASPRPWPATGPGARRVSGISRGPPPNTDHGYHNFSW